MSRIIRTATRDGAGYRVRVEFTGAYTDGSSRFEEVWVARDQLVGRTSAEKRQAVFDALAEPPLADIAGEDLAEPMATKEILEQRMESKYAEWQRWKNTREEAQARSLGAPTVNALTNKEDAVWAAYAALVAAWRAA